MLYIDYGEFHLIDGLGYLLPRTILLIDADDTSRMMVIPGGYEWCHECDGTGEGLEYCICGECAGDGYIPDLSLAGYCSMDGCEMATVNKSHGDWLCTDCDESRHVEIINFPSRYTRRLL